MQPNTRNALRAGAATLFVAMMVAAVVNAQGCAADPSPPSVQAAPEQVPAADPPRHDDPADEAVPAATPAATADGNPIASASAEASASAMPEDPPAFMGATKSGGIFHPPPTAPAQQPPTPNAPQQQQNAAPRQTP